MTDALRTRLAGMLRGGPAQMVDVDGLAYEEATLALEQQAAVLNELRSRTSTLIAVTALFATFLGKEVCDRPGVGVETKILLGLAMLALGAGILCCIQVLRPTVERDIAASRPARWRGGFITAVRGRSAAGGVVARRVFRGTAPQPRGVHE